LDNNLLIYGGIALLAIIVVVSLIKKAFKLILFIASILVLISLYNIFVKGVSPMEEFGAYKTNIQYGKDIAEYTGKIKTSTDKIKIIIEKNKLDETSLNTLKTENANLLMYQKEVKELKHSQKLNVFHDKYCDYLNTIVSTTENAAKLASAGNKTLKGAEDMISKLKTGIDNLSDLKLSVNK
jgi:ABC-type multidrug transport system fused ATPase/permease subunit